MIKKLACINDFQEVITGINHAKVIFSENYKDNKSKLISLITELSEPILNSCEKNKNNEQIYSTAALGIIEALKQDNNSTKKSFENWLDISKNILAIAFIMIDCNEFKFGPTDNELINVFLDYFSNTANRNVVAAHYFAARKLAGTEPKKCYDMTMKDFEIYPNLVKDVFNNVSYTYSPDLITDKIYERCPICGSDQSMPLYCAEQAVACDNDFAPAKLWMKCTGCNNLYAYNFPVYKTDTINGHYTHKNSGKILEPRHLLRIYSDIFNHAKELCKGNRYLEIGVGSGEMLAVALEMGYNVSAVEICKEDCENISNALGVDIKWCDFLDYNTDEKYDIIIMGDVLEHITKPIEAIEKAYSILSDDGVLWISTPNFDSAFTRMKKFSDPMWNQKNHFTYFSYDGLVPILDKMGLEVKRYDVSNRYNGSMELFIQKK